MSEKRVNKEKDDTMDTLKMIKAALLVVVLCALSARAASELDEAVLHGEKIGRAHV